MDRLLLPLLIGFTVVCTGIAVYLLLKVEKKRMAAWAEFAQRHGMRAHKLKVEGTYEGYPLTVETQTRGSGKSQYTVAVLHLWLQDAVPAEFSLERENFGDKVLRFFGKKDPEIGDAAFDQLFDLKNLSPLAAAVLRHPSVQEHLYELVNQYQNFHIREGWLQAERHTVPSTADELEDFTGPALMLAQTLQEASERSQRWTAPS